MKIKGLLKDEKGAAMPFVAIVLGLFALGFIALVIDAGTLYINRKAMVTSADSAALAGAQVLRTSRGLNEADAKKAAEDYAKANGADKFDVFVGSKLVTIPNGTVETRQVVEVTVSKNQSLIFARFLNDDAAEVKASAAATWGYVLKSSYMPIFIFHTGYKLEQDISLHNNIGEDKEDFKTNSYGFLEVNGKNSMKDINDAIRGNLSVNPISVGSTLGGIPGKRESVYDSAKTREKQIVIIPVIDWDGFMENNDNIDNKGAINGNAEKWKLPIAFFAYFEIDEVIKQNGNGNNGNGENNENGANNGNGNNNGNDGNNGNGGDVNNQNNGNKAVEIKGRFVGKADERNLVEAGDQLNLNENGDSPAAYSKLIK